MNPTTIFKVELSERWCHYWRIKPLNGVGHHQRYNRFNDKICVTITIKCILLEQTLQCVVNSLYLFSKGNRVLYNISSYSGSNNAQVLKVHFFFLVSPQNSKVKPSEKFLFLTSIPRWLDVYNSLQAICWESI